MHEKQEKKRMTERKKDAEKCFRRHFAPTKTNGSKEEEAEEEERPDKSRQMGNVKR
jgi:hypothetical protein